MSEARQRISGTSPYEGEIGFSRAMRVGDQVFVAGTAPVGDDGKTVGVGDVAAQTRRCLEIIEKALNDAGAKMEDVVRTRMFLTDASHWEAVGREHGAFFSDVRPAATMVVVSGLLDPDWLIEIEADAVVSQNPKDWDQAWAASDEGER